MAEVTEAHVTSSVCRGHGRSQIVSRQKQAHPCRPRSRTGCTEASLVN